MSASHICLFARAFRRNRNAAMMQLIRHGKCRRCHTPPSPPVVSPRSRVLSSFSSPPLWPFPIHGNDKTVTSRAISEVRTSHHLLPSVPPSPHSLSILGLGQPAMSGLLVSYVVNPNSLPISTFHLLGSSMQDSRPLKSTEHDVRHDTGYATSTDPISHDSSK